MITNEEKIEIIINKLNNLNLIIKSYSDNAEALKNKYNLEDKINLCNTKKNVLLNELNILGGVWQDS